MVSLLWLQIMSFIKEASMHQTANTSPDINWQPSGLANELIRLQPLTADDFEKLYTVASDPRIWEQHPESDRYLRERFLVFFEGAIRSGSAFLIIDNTTGQPIGSTRFYHHDREQCSVFIGYTFLSAEYWGGRYNKALKKLMLDYAFRFVDKVRFHIGIRNLRSQKAVARLGAQKTGELIAEHEKDSRYEYTLSREEYETGNF